MGTQNRGTLKSFFLKNKFPTESNFADLIDSFINKTDDGMLVGDPSADTNFRLAAKPCILSGTLSVLANSDTITGKNTQFKTELREQELVNINGVNYTVKSIADKESFTINGTTAEAFTDVKGTVWRDVLSVWDNNNQLAFYISKDGRVGINKKPETTLDVGGNVRATGFNGDGSGLTNLTASKIEGRIDKKNLPPADPINISDISGLLTITEAYDQKLTGAVSGDKNTDVLTGTGIDFTKLTAGQKISIATKIHEVLSIDQDKITLKTKLTDDIHDQPVYVGGNFLSLKDTEGKELLTIDAKGGIKTNGPVIASSFTGDGSGLINLSASKIEGRIDKKNLPPAEPVNISEISGLLTITEAYDQKLAGAVSGDKDTDVLTGIGIDFTKLSAGQKISIATKIHEVLSLDQDKIILKTKLTDDIHDQPVYVGGNFLSLKDTDDKEVLTIDAKGGVKTTGTLTASGFTGDGSGLINLSASKIEGRIDKKNLPPAEPVNISDISGLLTITEAYDQKLEGTVSGAKDSDTLTCAGIDFSKLSAGQRVSVARQVLEIRDFENNTVTLNNRLTEGVTDQPVFVAGRFLSLKNIAGAEVLNIDPAGSIGTAGLVTAAGFTGDGSKLTDLSAAELRGPISVDNLPPLDFPSDLNGQLTINGAYDQRHEGTVSGMPGSAVLTGTGTSFKRVLADGQKIRVATTVVEILTVTSDTELTLQAPLADELINQSFFTAGNFLSLVDADKRNIAQIDENGDIYTHGKVFASQFSGDGASLVNLQAAQLQGIVPPGQIAQYINLLSDKTVLNGEETATLSWASHSIDELRLHYLQDGQLKALSTKDDPTSSIGSNIGLQQSSFPLNLYQTTTITLTGLRSSVMVYQQQVTIAVIQNINQYIAQIRYEGYNLPLVVNMSVNRFGLTTLNEQNLLKLAGAIKNNNFDRNTAIDSIRDHYKNSGQAWDPSVYDLLLYQVFDGDLQYQINAVIKQLASANTLPDVLVHLVHQFPIGALTDKNVKYLATGIYGIKAYPLAEIFRYIPQFFRTQGGVWLPQQHGIILQSICSN